MEEHRLKAMPDNYDKALFEKLYKDTKKLRKKLAHNIDANRFKVSYEDVVSWFDIKFIFVFQKYYGKMEPNVLKGHIISSLTLYQNRIMRMSYSQKHNLQNIVNYEDAEDMELIAGVTKEEETLFRDAAMNYLKNNLPDEAFLIFQIELYPPYYIIKKLEQENKNIQKIPARLIAEYLGWDNCNKVNKLRNLIEKVKTEARDYFESNPLSLSEMQ